MRAKDHGFQQPAEWARHLSVWTAWPHLADEWAEGLDGPRASLAQMIAAIVDRGPAGPRGERVDLLVRDAAAEADARSRLGPATAGVRFHRAYYGDVWLRDTGPIFVTRDHERAAACFRWNGWGGKYLMPGDDAVSTWVAGAAGVPAWPQGFVLEGGAVEVDGEGTVLTTKQCLLGGARNPGVDQAGGDQAARGRARRRPGDLARSRAGQRSHRRPHRHARAVRGAGRGGRDGADRRRPQPRGARRASSPTCGGQGRPRPQRSRWSRCRRRARSRTRPARSCRPAT
jgi:hypothetical protein